MNKDSEELSADCVDLIKHVIEKHNKAVLEEFRVQLKMKNQEINRLKSVLRKVVLYQVSELGAHAIRDLLKELDGEL